MNIGIRCSIRMGCSIAMECSVGMGCALCREGVDIGIRCSIRMRCSIGLVRGFMDSNPNIVTNTSLSPCSQFSKTWQF